MDRPMHIGKEQTLKRSFSLIPSSKGCIILAQSIYASAMFFAFSARRSTLPRSSSGLRRHPASYTQQYFAQEKAIRAPGDEAAYGIRKGEN